MARGLGAGAGGGKAKAGAATASFSAEVCFRRLQITGWYVRTITDGNSGCSTQHRTVIL